MATGFNYVGSLSATNARIFRKGIIANSQVITVGDATGRDVDGFITIAGVGNLVEGIVHGIVRSDTKDIAPTSNGAGGNFTDTYTAAVDNETVSKVSALMDISKNSMYAVTLDDTAGSTTGSDLAGGYNADVVAASDQLDESTTATTTAQFAILGQNSEVTNGVFVSIKESVIFG